MTLSLHTSRMSLLTPPAVLPLCQSCCEVLDRDLDELADRYQIPPGLSVYPLQQQQQQQQQQQHLSPHRQTDRRKLTPTPQPPAFDAFFSALSEEEKLSFARSLWEVLQKHSGEWAATPSAASTRPQFITRSDSSIQLATFDEACGGDTVSVPSPLIKDITSEYSDTPRPPSTIVLPPPTPVDNESRLPGHDENLAKLGLKKGSLSWSRGSKEGDSNPFGKYESFASITDHEVVETTACRQCWDDEGFKTINDYTQLDELGRGSFGKVKLVVHNPTNTPYALKIIPRCLQKKLRGHPKLSQHPDRLDQVRMELAIMKKIAHPRIVKLHEVIDDPYKNKIYLVLDYIDGGVVCEVGPEGTTSPIPAEKVAKYMRDIVSGLGYLHRHNIVHRDIKPSNILLDKKDSAYLCDFGVSAIIESENDVVDGCKGTPYFFSPEICEGGKEVHGKPADVWALGATLYVMLFGELPFKGRGLGVIDKIQNEALVIPPEADPDQASLLKRMLNKSAKARIVLGEVKIHPFLATGGATHPSRKSLTPHAPIVINQHDFLNAFSKVVETHPKAYSAKAISYVRRYCTYIRYKAQSRKVEAAREKRRSQESSP